MRRLFKRYADVIYVVLTAIDVLAAAVIVDRIEKSAFVPWGLASTALLAVSILVHVTLYRETATVANRTQEDILGKVFEIAARALVFPESWDTVPVRCYCHRFDRRLRKLNYYTSKASNIHDDQFTDIPVDEFDQDGKRIFVIAEAVASGRTVFRELTETRSTAEERAAVWAPIRFVLACPVYEWERPKSESTCLGVVSFDTSKEGGKKVNLNSKRARDIIAELARTTSLLWS